MIFHSVSTVSHIADGRYRNPDTESAMIEIKGIITKTRTLAWRKKRRCDEVVGWSVFERSGCRQGSNSAFPQQADFEYGLSALVQHFHPPFGVLLQAAGNAAGKVGAHLDHFGLGGLVALKLRALIGCAGIATMTYLEKI